MPTGFAFRLCRRYRSLAALNVNVGILDESSLCTQLRLENVRLTKLAQLPDCRQTGMYGPPLRRNRKVSVTRLVCANVYGLYWSESLLARMECAALSSPLVIQSRERLLPVTGLESAGFDRCAISSFASRPGKKPQSPRESLSCSYIG